MGNQIHLIFIIQLLRIYTLENISNFICTPYIFATVKLLLMDTSKRQSPLYNGHFLVASSVMDPRSYLYRTVISK